MFNAFGSGGAESKEKEEQVFEPYTPPDPNTVYKYDDGRATTTPRAHGPSARTQLISWNVTHHIHHTRSISRRREAEERRLARVGSVLRGGSQGKKEEARAEQLLVSPASKDVQV